VVANRPDELATMLAGARLNLGNIQGQRAQAAKAPLEAAELRARALDEYAGARGALEKLTEGGDADIKRLLMSVRMATGVELARGGRLPEAVAEYRAALDQALELAKGGNPIDERNVGRVLHNLGMAHARQGDWDSAVKAF